MISEGYKLMFDHIVYVDDNTNVVLKMADICHV